MKLVNINQARARFALEKVKGQSEEYKRYAKRLPSMIVRNGLALTLAFYKSKGGKHQTIYQHLGEWFNKQGLVNNKENLLEELLEKDALTYRQWAKEALSIAIWLQKMAEAEIKTSGEEK